MANSAQRSVMPRLGTALPIASADAPRIPLTVFGLSLGLFFAVTFVFCVSFDLLFPSQAMYPNWQRFLPGFTSLTWTSFLLGLVESFAYGWYVALIFCPLFNFFSARFR